MWKYAQQTHTMFDPAGASLDSTCYSGKGAAKNDPDQQCVADLGPIPRGMYTIGAAATHPRLGPVVMALTPDDEAQMCGRFGFFIHGDSVADPGNASDGCIIAKRTTRETIDGSTDRRLQVVRDSALFEVVAMVTPRAKAKTKAKAKRKPKSKPKSRARTKATTRSKGRSKSKGKTKSGRKTKSKARTR